MRVVAPLALYPPGQTGGAFLSTHELLRFLAARGHQVDVILAGGLGRSYEHEGVTVWSPAGAPNDLLPNASVVISHGGDRNRGAGMAHLYHKPSVRMLHGKLGDRQLHARLNAYEGTALLIANSLATKHEVAWDGPTVVLHPPVFTDDYRTTPGDRVTLVNLSGDKGGRLFWHLTRELPTVPFLGVLGAYGRQFRGTAPNVILQPFTTNMRDDVYARTRVLLVPSAEETWGRVAVEAMASGIPVIAHPTPGLMECLGGTGMSVDRRDEKGWVAAVTSLMYDEELWGLESGAAIDRAAEFDPLPELTVAAENIEAVAAGRPLPCMTGQ